MRRFFFFFDSLMLFVPFVHEAVFLFSFAYCRIVTGRKNKKVFYWITYVREKSDERVEFIGRHKRNEIFRLFRTSRHDRIRFVLMEYYAFWHHRGGGRDTTRFPIWSTNEYTSMYIFFAYSEKICALFVKSCLTQSNSHFSRCVNYISKFCLFCFSNIEKTKRL